jgi:tRNA(Phe) wybutosine-synthesizing methylase Tyw3
MKTFYFLLTFLLFGVSAYSQDNSGVEMADVMRSNGKIYVVVAVLCIVLAVLLSYLLSIDRKVSRLEQKMKEKQP